MKETIVINDKTVNYINDTDNPIDVEQLIASVTLGDILGTLYYTRPESQPIGKWWIDVVNWKEVAAELHKELVSATGLLNIKSDEVKVLQRYQDAIKTEENQ